MNGISMRSKKLLYAGLGVFLSLSLCVGILAASSYVFTAIGDRFDTRVSDLPLAPFLEATEESFVEEVQTPIGAEIDLETLFQPFWESREILMENFYRQPIDEALLAQGALDGLFLAIDDAGVDLSEILVPLDAESVTSLSTEAQTPEEIEALYASFWETWQKVEYADLGEELSYEELMRSALRNMVLILDDPYTSYLDPEENRQASIPLDGEYEGIGAWVDTTSEYLTIIAPMEGSPAEAAGLQPGDAIIAVDGEDMSGIDGSLVIRRVLGPAGSTVVLTIQREGLAESFDVEIERARITVPNVEAEMLDEDIAYVQLFNFGDRAPRDLKQALEDLLAQNPQGLILDLRNNGGGFLTSAVDITSQFLDEGVVLYEEYSNGERDVFDVQGTGLATDIPMIVLVNEGTASASEILAGAVQDYERGLLVGTTTFGKGSVQLPITLAENQGALRVTIAIWLTPEERHIQETGLEPDVVVEISQEDVEAERDPQLDMAVELLVES